ncbi:hypothetical protein AQ490_02075 [Wenjunlia vitaminophila]|uniref:Uncharacterized protein n=1 Tax=Wenjunlia vitaminophila TaxID=76728 RepID=A0A0T6LYF4_WENVI|nr:hypothetical protein [Wenjunlia vitaminophila]KRV51017.1 hypothetical protein AQ490_02075 [Wenjunlia vitaminophila]
MFCLRLARGSRPIPLLRGLLLAVVSGGVGFLLLATLTRALTHPEQTTPAITQLLWCLLPVAATAPLAAACSRLATGGNLDRSLAASGNGSRRLAGVAATATALAGAFGSALALLVFLPLSDTVVDLVADERATAPRTPSLPLAGTVTLLSVVPLVSAGSALAAHRLRPGPTGRRAPGSPLPWRWLRDGAAVTAVGLAVELGADRLGPGRQIEPPGGLAPVPVGVLVGWTLTVTGFAMAGPGLIGLGGRLLASVRPGVLRLLAGRGLEADAVRLGHPMGLVCAAGCAVLAGTRLAQDSGSVRLEPLTVLGAALILFCVVATALTATARAHQLRAGTRATMAGFGAPASLLRRAALLRGSVLVGLLGPLTWAVAELAASPLH